MKKCLSLLLVFIMVFSLCAVSAGAAGAYEGKTVILYTGNVRGDVDLYAKIAQVKKDYEAKGADVLLVDAGNYLQGTAAANSDRGLSVYNLMDAAGYDVAAMGLAEFGYGNATNGYIYHSMTGGRTAFHTQALLQKGAEEVTYWKTNQQFDGDESKGIKDTRAAKEPAKFATVASNVKAADMKVSLTTTQRNEAEKKYVSTTYDVYSFEASKVITTKSGLKVLVYGITDPDVMDNIQAEIDTSTWEEAAYLKEISDPKPVAKGSNDVVVCLSNADVNETYGDVVIEALYGEDEIVGAYVIDNATKEVKEESVKLPSSGDSTVAAIAKAAKDNASKIVGTSSVILNGDDSANWTGETNLGDLVTDALAWYAANYIDGIDKDMPIIGMFNGGNLDQFIYTGDVTELDMAKALPFPRGVGVLCLTGEQILTALEVGAQKSDEARPGLLHVSNLSYEIDIEKEYDPGELVDEKYDLYKANSVNRVTITEINGEAYDPKKTYAVVADNLTLLGGDGHYELPEFTEAGAKYIDSGVKARDAVSLFIQEKLKGKIGEEYAEPQGRFGIGHNTAKCVSAKFTDVSKDAKNWTHKPIDYVLTNKIMVGVSDTKFEPNKDVTRAMVAQILYAEAGKPSVKGLANNFTDLKEGAWYYDAVLWANSKGIVAGYPDKTFKPNAPIARQELMTILHTYAKISGKDMSAKEDISVFSDASSISKYAVESMTWGYSHGLISGISKTVLAPKGTASRAMVATIMMAYLEKL